MRTNIEIDDALMAAAMEAGGFKTKKEAVEEGLRLVRRRQVYEGLLALRGKLQWDDSDAAWALAGKSAVQEPEAPYAGPVAAGAKASKPRKPTGAAKAKSAVASKPATRGRSKSA